MGSQFDAIVVGAGPAGSAFAAALARAGGRVALVDGRPPGFAKPCGGALPFDALKHDFPACARDLEESMRFPSVVQVTCCGAAQADLEPISRVHLGVCDRRELDARLTAEAEHWGAAILAGRADGIERSSHGWRARVAGESLTAPVLIGADGWQSLHRGVRHVCMGDAGAVSRVLAGCGAYLDGAWEPRVARVDLPDGLAGYAWAFTGRAHTSVGCVGPLTCNDDWRAVTEGLEGLLRQRGGALCVRARFHCLLPCASPGAPSRPISGANWAVIGDAAGLVDPITGAGLLYALRSGILAAESLLMGDLSAFAAHWWETPEGRHLLAASRAYEAAMRLAAVAGPSPVHELIRESYCSL